MFVNEYVSMVPGKSLVLLVPGCLDLPIPSTIVASTAVDSAPVAARGTAPTGVALIVVIARGLPSIDATSTEMVSIDVASTGVVTKDKTSVVVISMVMALSVVTSIAVGGIGVESRGVGTRDVASRGVDGKLPPCCETLAVDDAVSASGIDCCVSTVVTSGLMGSPPSSLVGDTISALVVVTLAHMLVVVSLWTSVSLVSPLGGLLVPWLGLGEDADFEAVSVGPDVTEGLPSGRVHQEVL